VQSSSGVTSVYVRQRLHGLEVINGDMNLNVLYVYLGIHHMSALNSEINQGLPCVHGFANHCVLCM
jgi:hypothetical protein